MLEKLEEQRAERARDGPREREGERTGTGQETGQARKNGSLATKYNGVTNSPVGAQVEYKMKLMIISCGTCPLFMLCCLRDHSCLGRV